MVRDGRGRTTRVNRRHTMSPAGYVAPNPGGARRDDARDHIRWTRDEAGTDRGGATTDHFSPRADVVLTRDGEAARLRKLTHCFQWLGN